MTKENDIHIIFFAFRYALGRRTAAPSIVIDKIKETWSEFSMRDKEMFLAETSNYLGSEPKNDFSSINQWNVFFSWGTERLRKDKIDDIIK